MNRERERRRIQRVRLSPPLKGRVGTHRVFVLDISTHGLRIAHQEPLGARGESLHLIFDWDGTHIDLETEIRWSSAHRDRRAGDAETLYHTGVSVKRTEAASHLRQIVMAHVIRALDEQKANARGIPAAAPSSFQTARSTSYVRHQYIGGVWREVPTSDPRQPITGFTIDAAHDPGEVALLRESYTKSDEAGRARIRKMAGLSLATPGGIPTRRYKP